VKIEIGLLSRSGGHRSVAGNLAAQTNETTFTAATARANVTAAAVGAKIARSTTAAVFSAFAGGDQFHR
jgi:hypothetical protein